MNVLWCSIISFRPHNWQIRLLTSHCPKGSYIINLQNLLTSYVTRWRWLIQSRIQNPVKHLRWRSMFLLLYIIVRKKAVKNLWKMLFYFSKKKYFVSRYIRAFVLPSFPLVPPFPIAIFGHCWIYRRSWLKINPKNYDVNKSNVQSFYATLFCWW